MQLHDIVKPMDELTDDELLERLRTVRHNRTIARPAAAKRFERAETKTRRAKATKIDKLAGQLTDAERQALIAQLQKDLEA